MYLFALILGLTLSPVLSMDPWEIDDLARMADLQAREQGRQDYPPEPKKPLPSIGGANPKRDKVGTLNEDDMDAIAAYRQAYAVDRDEDRRNLPAFNIPANNPRSAQVPQVFLHILRKIPK